MTVVKISWSNRLWENLVLSSRPRRTILNNILGIDHNPLFADPKVKTSNMDETLF